MHPAALDYLKWYHETNIWKQVSYRGVRTLKLPSDMWSYQEILFAHGIEWVIETGSRHGGSALFFADLLRNARSPGRVFSIDYAPELDPRAAADLDISFIKGDSADPAIVGRVMGEIPRQRSPLFLILDSDHAAAHVRRELDIWVPELRTGDYLVVEDTIVNGNPVRPSHGPGPLEAIRAYRADHPEALKPDTKREAKFGATFAIEGFYTKA
ncbi:CmcI family methyltransferase [uncultured Phenylobacterium sp.]|uniref:CmcI family methyltransferase n=1 Tax=uncultured Phenylobacterium sp. TaxID=349273 RepID=UPI0025D98C01|nr:CmcI family methyltransferase [uncultured Phenylobacterium sp.]